jgi:hypothetical protein
MIRYERHHGSQILQIQQQHPLIVRKLKGDVEDPFLRLIELEQSSKKQRSHLGNRSPNRMSLLAEQVPEDRGECVGLIVFYTDLLYPLIDFGMRRRGLANSGQVPFYVRHEHGYALFGKPFRQDLQ